MSFSGGQIDQTAFAEEIYLASVTQCILIDEVASQALGRSQFLQRGNIDLDVKVSRVGNNGAVLPNPASLSRL
jgi:hypothetical protein